jgi:hypothetical protein
MRILYLATFLLVAGNASATGSAAAGGFVKGVTTVAQAEQGLGAPMDTTMNPDGALNLVYPAARFAERMPAAVPGVAAAKARTVVLRFGTDFTYLHATTKSANLGLAAR